MREVFMTSSGGRHTDVRSDRPYRGVKKKSDVADGESRDRADFLVAEATFEFQMHDLALIGREGLNRRAHLREGLARVMPGFEVGGHLDVGFVERRQAPRRLPGVEREIASDREEPGRDPSVEPLAIFAAQPEERFLDDVTSGVQIAEQPLRIAEQRLLIFGQRPDYPLRGLPHGVPNEDNGAALVFLEMNVRNPKRCNRVQKIQIFTAAPDRTGHRGEGLWPLCRIGSRQIGTSKKCPMVLQIPE
jgi:hypothetical protein